MSLPQHAGLDTALDYRYGEALSPGQLVRVPLGRREVLGVVWASELLSEEEAQALKPVQALLPLPALDAGWRRLVAFAAGYYQRGLGEFALQALPVGLHQATPAALQRRQRAMPQVAHSVGAAGLASEPPMLNEAQLAAVAAVCAQFEPGAARPPLLLWGVTGSGKTEVYLHAAAEALARGLQVLVLVPEINLTPQLEARFAARFGAERLVTLHSALTPARRLRHWLAAHRGEAQLVLGTRLAVMASLPRLGLIVVDEEHDASFKAQDGARHSARDLAVLRAAQAEVPVLLGSATPSLETWQHSLSGRYHRLDLPQRVNAAPLPAIRLLDTTRLPRSKGVAQPPMAQALIDAMEQRRLRGEQSLLLLNRRGYAPVLQCGACAWKSDCPHCSAWRVFHKGDRTLRCHHCGFTEPVPKRCPDCGNTDILPVGRGTERLAEQIGEWLPQARVLRLDADTTRAVGSLEAQLAQVHAGEVDVVVGTQMIAKGHDFRRVSLVAALNPDTMLFSSDFRAPERLFALLLQAAGRAGRAGGGGEVWIQTGQPQHPLFQALLRSDYAGFASQQLEERQAAGLPPFAHLALLRADSREQLQARDFLAACAELGQQLAPELSWYPPVPHPVARVANQWRWQMLVESPHRPPLQRALQAWMPEVLQLARQHRGVLRWAIDVDPSGI
ncbi:primosomal protein N' [Inhella sp.]|uniref:replication restart helicase PriA n=1 Tax=Inhella sp. TaxID=1921806 RepID=UPI0035AD8BF9